MLHLGFGTATLGRETGEDLSFRLLDAAFELGIRHFDTAEAYGGGNARAYRKTALGVEDIREASGLMHSSEILLGRWVRDRGIRDQITLATKVSSGFHQAQVESALTRSMERLQVDFLDIYYLHAIPAAVPLSEPLAVIEQACDDGRVASIGVSNASQVNIEEAKGHASRLAYCQNPFNLVQCGESFDALRYCAENGIAFVAYSPLAAGFLTGKYGPRGEVDVKGTRFDVIPAHREIYLTEAGLSVLARLEEASVKSGIPKHLLALAWVLRQKEISITLIGATRLEHLHNAVLAQSLVADDEIWASLLPPATVA